MTHFNTNTHLSDSPSTPQVIPDRPACNVNDILSFSSWNDEIDEFRNSQDFFISAGEVRSASRTSDPVPIVRSNSRPTSTSSFDLPDLTPSNQCSDQDLNGQSESMADWSMPNYPESQSNYTTNQQTNQNRTKRYPGPPIEVAQSVLSARGELNLGLTRQSNEEFSDITPVEREFDSMETRRGSYDSNGVRESVENVKSARSRADSWTPGSANNGVTKDKTSRNRAESWANNTGSSSAGSRKNRYQVATSVSPQNGHHQARTDELSQWSNLAESCTDDPSSLTSSWVNLPPVSGSRRAKREKAAKTGEFQNANVIIEHDHRQSSDSSTRSKIGRSKDTRRNSNSERRNSNLERRNSNPENSGQSKRGQSDASNCTTPVLSPCDEDRVLALNSWTDVNDEHLQSPSSRTIPGSKPRSTGYPWSELFSLDSSKSPSKHHNTTSPIHQNDRKLKDKLLSKFSMRREPSPTNSHQERRLSDQGGLTRVSLERGNGPGRMYTTSPHGFYPSLAGYNVDTGDTIKTKLQSAWNNVKYGWTVKAPTHFSEEKPLFLLGKCYHSKIDESVSHESPIRSIDKFRQDFGSRLWFTYRREFLPLAGSNLTTDCGWGCMLRSGQMMLAQAFVLHYLRRDWNWYCGQTPESERYHRQIVRWFLDSPSNQAPFSIHNLVKLGSRGMGKKAGDWYGPASIAQIMSRAMEEAPELNPSLEDVCVYVAPDCTLYVQDVYDLCTRRYRAASDPPGAPSPPRDAPGPPRDATWRSVVILIPVRLGGEALNSIYIPCLKHMLSQDCCLGIMGGKPKHSLYFIGWQDDKLIYLDPHYCQDAVVTNQKDSLKDFPLHTYHCMSPRKMSFNRMDPSCTIGFYCRTEEDFIQFIDFTREAVSPPLQKSQYPMFIFVDGRSSDVTDKQTSHVDDVMDFHSNSLIQSTIDDPLPQQQRSRGSTRTSEEFVFL